MVDLNNLRGRKHRQAKQNLKERYAKVREDAQLAGIIATTAEGALRDERVKPANQSEQQLPHLVAESVRNGWATPDHVKPKIVDALVKPFIETDTAVAPDGTVYEIPPDRHLLKENAKVLAMLDKMQHERDNPEDADNSININNEVNVVTWDNMKQPPKHIAAQQPDEIEMRIANVTKEVKDGATTQEGSTGDVQEVQGQQAQDR